MHGEVVRLNTEGKFGFIAGDDGREFFFHMTGLNGTEFEELAEGSAVEFTESDNRAGDRPDEEPRAVNVRLAEDELPAVANEPLPPEKAP